MKKSKKLSPKEKESMPVDVQAESEKNIIDRFWDLADLVKIQLQHEKCVSDELLSIIEMQKERRENVFVEMQSVINDELESAGFCLECGEFIETCGSAHEPAQSR